jgi:hypothetical protein
MQMMAKIERRMRPLRLLERGVRAFAFGGGLRLGLAGGSELLVLLLQLGD